MKFILPALLLMMCGCQAAPPCPNLSPAPVISQSQYRTKEDDCERAIVDHDYNFVAGSPYCQGYEMQTAAIAIERRSK